MLSEERADRRLDARFRKRHAAPSQQFVLDVEFQAAQGFTIVFGPSGAGKTTLLDCIAGLTRPDSGGSRSGIACCSTLSNESTVRSRSGVSDMSFSRWGYSRI